MVVMEAVNELDTQLFLDRVRRAGAMSVTQRFLAGPELFDHACEISRAGIRQQRPDASKPEVERELRRRVIIGAALEELR